MEEKGELLKQLLSKTRELIMSTNRELASELTTHEDEDKSINKIDC